MPEGVGCTFELQGLPSRQVLPQYAPATLLYVLVQRQSVRAQCGRSAGGDGGWDGGAGAAGGRTLAAVWPKPANALPRACSSAGSSVISTILGEKYVERSTSDKAMAGEST